MGLFEAIAGSVQYFVFHQRARGTFFNPDFYGEYLAIIFSVQLGRFFDNIPLPLWEGARGRVKDLFRWLDLSMLLLLAMGILLSQSRGAALAWSVGVSVVLWKRYRYKIVYAWLILFLLFLIVPNPLQHRFLHDYREDPYSLSRFDMWKEAIHIIKDHPEGIGLEMYPLISPQYAFSIDSNIKHYSKIAESPHDDYLRLFSEFGVVGGIFFVGSMGIFYLKWTDNKNRSFTHYGILGATLVFFVHALVDSNFHEPALVITVIILSTLLLDKRLFHLSFNASPLTPHPSRFIFYFFLFTFSFLLVYLIIKPPIAWFYYSKGYNQTKNPQEEAAQPKLKKAIFWESQNARYHNALANSYFNIFQKTNYYGWVFKALEELNQALSLNPIDGIYFKLKGEIYSALAVREIRPEHIEELYGKAFTNYNEALKLLPYDVTLYVALGLVEESSGKTEDAIQHYSQAVLIEPNYLIAREKKIEMLLRLGKKEEALKNYQELVSLYNQIKGRAVTDPDKAFIYFNEELLKTQFNNSTIQQFNKK